MDEIVSRVNPQHGRAQRCCVQTISTSDFGRDGDPALEPGRVSDQSSHATTSRFERAQQSAANIPRGTREQYKMLTIHATLENGRPLLSLLQDQLRPSRLQEAAYAICY